MTYRWATSPDVPDDVAARLDVNAGFADQASAEAWLTEHYLDLAEAGVQAVVLVEADRVVYGPMSLSE